MNRHVSNRNRWSCGTRTGYRSTGLLRVALALGMAAWAGLGVTALPPVRAAAAAAAATTAGGESGGGTLRPDDAGYIRDWLLLAPIPLPPGGQAGDLLLQDQLPDEARLRPAEGQTVTVRGRTFTWRRITAAARHVDINELLKSQNDQMAGYLVTYVECDREIPEVTMSVASNDQGRIYFNGTDIYAFTEARPLMLDADKGRVTLKKGINVIVFKVLNEQNSWQASMRLTDKAGAPLSGVRIRLVPGPAGEVPSRTP